MMWQSLWLLNYPRYIKAYWYCEINTQDSHKKLKKSRGNCQKFDIYMVPGFNNFIWLLNHLKGRKVTEQRLQNKY